MDLVTVLGGCAIFVLANLVAFFLGKGSWGAKLSKLYFLTRTLVESLADGTIDFAEAQKIATAIKDLLAK